MTRKQTVIHLHGNVKDNVLAKDLNKGEIIVLHPESGATEFGTLDYSGKIAWFQDYDSTKAYIDTEVEKVSNRVATLEGLTGTTQSALQEITKGSDGSYVTTTIGKKTGDKKQSVGVAVTVQEVSGATADNKGLAEALDVKNYVDGAKNAVQGEIDAVNAKIGDGFSETSTVAGQLSAVKTTADSAVQTVESDTYIALTKEGTKVSLSSNVENNLANATGDEYGTKLADAKATKAYVDGEFSKLKAVAKTGAAADVTVADEANNFSGETKTVESVLAQIGTNIKTAGAVTITSPEVTDDATLKSYVFTQNGHPIGTINIPKDLVATSGELVNQNGTGEKGTFIKMTIDNGNPFYIDVASLIEYNTVESTDEITLTDTEHKITATIKAVNGSKLVDGSVAKTKLSTELQGSIDKADSALQKTDITEGTANGTIKVKDGDVKVHGLDSAAYKKETDFDAAGAASGVLGSDTDTKDKATVYGVQAYVKEVETALGGKNVSADVVEGETLVSATASGNKVTVGSTETLKNAVANANSAVQTVTVTNTTANKITATKAENSTEVVLNFDSMVIDCGEF